MVKAYVGIANWCGLESLLLEGHRPFEASTSWSDYGAGCNRALFWAAVSDDVAQEVRALLAAGQRLQALRTLDALATDIAPLGCGSQWTSSDS